MKRKAKKTILFTSAFSFILLLSFNVCYYFLKPTGLIVFAVINLLISSACFALSWQILNYSLFSHFKRLNSAIKENKKKSGLIEIESDKTSFPEEFHVLVGNLNSFISQYEKNIRTETSENLLLEIRNKISTIDASLKNTELLSPATDSAEKVLMHLDEILGSNASENEKITETAIAATKGLKAVSETIDGINKIASSFEETEFSISSLYKRTNEIKDLISQIDGQIDLANHLALNSAIEAARIGDERKGFAVISNELKKLSQKIAETTKKMREALDQAERIRKAQEIAASEFAGQGLSQERLEEETQKIIEALKAQERELQKYTEKWDALKSGINLKDVVDTLQDLGEGFRETAFQTLVVDFPEGFGNAVADTIMEGKSLKDGLSSLFKSLAKQVISQIVMMITQMLIMKAIMATMGMPAFGPGMGFGGMNSIFGSIGKIGSGLKKLKFFADGGRPPVGVASIVGERGPELFVPDTPGTIIPNEQMGGTVVIQRLEIMPGANIDQALMDKPATYWVDLAQEKILPA